MLSIVFSIIIGYRSCIQERTRHRKERRRTRKLSLYFWEYKYMHTISFFYSLTSCFCCCCYYLSSVCMREKISGKCYYFLRTKQREGEKDENFRNKIRVIVVIFVIVLSFNKKQRERVSRKQLLCLSVG